jgi:hypothetical protein
MSMLRNDLIAWLNTLPEDCEVGVDDGGLTLQVVNDDEPLRYIEIGGIPEADPVCDECGATIPYLDTASMINPNHAESCSLHPSNVVGEE